jgi:hypothetical protein
MNEILKNSRNNCWQYEMPPVHGYSVAMLTIGGIPIIGNWKKNEGFIAWCKIPSIQDYLLSTFPPPKNKKIFLKTIGGITLIGEWQNGNAFSSWADLPERNRTKEAEIALINNKKYLK